MVGEAVADDAGADRRRRGRRVGDGYRLSHATDISALQERARRASPARSARRARASVGRRASPSPSRIASSSARCSAHRALELVRPVERQRPDPQRERVVLLERRLEEGLCARAVDRRGGSARRGRSARGRRRRRRRAAPRAARRSRRGSALGRALGGQPRRLGLEHQPAPRRAARARATSTVVTNMPRRGKTSTSCSCASRRSASRTGVRPIPSRSISSRSSIGSPGASSSETISSRIA